MPDRCFFDALDRYGDRPALLFGDRTVSYDALERMVAASVERIGPGRRLIFVEARNDPQAIADYLACLRLACPVFLFGEGERQKIDPLVQSYQPGLIIAADEERLALPARPFADDLRLLLSTSGTTGSAKFVKLSTRNIVSNALSIADYLGIGPDDRAISTLRFNYSFGLSIVHSHLAVGASIVLTDHSVVEPAFWEIARAQGITSISGVPHSFELLRDRADDLASLGSLRYLAQAGGRLPPPVVQEFAALGARQGWKLFVMYGQTEASPRIAYLPPELAAEHPDCIGVPIPGGTLEVLDEHGTPVADGAEGELAYSGPNVMMGYATGPAELASDETPPRLLTGDIARRNAAGLFQIVGRRARFVKPFGLRVNLDEVEAQARAIVPGAVATGTDERIVIAVEPAAKGSEAGLVDSLAARYRLPAAAFAVLHVPEIPRLANGKTDYRAILGLHALEADARDASRNPADGKLSDALARLLNRTDIPEGASFLSLGGDSLSYVQAALLIEDHLGQLPPDWESTPLTALDGMARKARGSLVSIESSVVVRALAILVVVLDHAWWFGIQSASIALLMVAGANFVRFQVPKILEGRIGMILFQTGVKVILPYFAIVAVTLFFHKRFFLAPFLFYANLTGGVYNAAGNRILVPYWFVEDYILLMVAFTLAFSLPWLRRRAMAQMWRIGLILFLSALAIGVVAMLNREVVIFRPTTVIAILWIFALGWLIQVADTAARRRAAGVLGLIAMLVMGYEFAIRKDALHIIVYFGFALIMLLGLVLRTLRIPRWLVPPVSAIAASSYYIYLTHSLVLHFIRDENSFPEAMLAVALSAVVGFIGWRISEWFYAQLVDRLPQGFKTKISG